MTMQTNSVESNTKKKLALAIDHKKLRNRCKPIVLYFIVQCSWALKSVALKCYEIIVYVKVRCGHEKSLLTADRKECK